MYVHTFHKNTLKSHFKNYIADCIYIKQLRPATIKSYQEVFDNLNKLVPELKHLEDLSPGIITTFYNRLRQKNKGKLQASTIRTYYDKLTAFFRWLEIKGYIEEGSLVKKITKPAQPRYEDEKALSEQDITKLLSAITLHTIGDMLLYLRDTAIILILIYTGVRKGELLGLRICDINWETKQLQVNAQTSKSKKHRNIPIHPMLFKHLKTYISELRKRKIKTEYLIISTRQLTKFTQHGLKHWVNRYKKLAGVKFHVHQFRHSFACNLAKHNADIISIRNLLGHSSVQMTERYLRSIGTESTRAHINNITY